MKKIIFILAAAAGGVGVLVLLLLTVLVLGILAAGVLFAGYMVRAAWRRATGSGHVAGLLAGLVLGMIPAAQVHAGACYQAPAWNYGCRPVSCRPAAPVAPCRDWSTWSRPAAVTICHGGSSQTVCRSAWSTWSCRQPAASSMCYSPWIR
jgi:hypothetical protein